MRPTEILSQEHRVIEVMLQVLGKISQQAEAERKLAKEPAEQALDFIRTFADGCHHGKEEGQLFPAMEARGIPSENGPIAVMLSDHEQGRLYVRSMAAVVEDAAAGNAEAIAKFAENARAYINLLTMHIHKEDNILFPMADRAFTEQHQQEVLEQFSKVESHDMGDGTHEKYLDLVRSLAKQYGVNHDAVTGTGCGCGHHDH